MSREINYNEERITPYIPDDIITPGTVTALDWRHRRNALLKLLTDEEYGEIPPRPQNMTQEQFSCRSDALAGLAERRETRLHFRNNGVERKLDVLLYMPRGVKGKIPVFAGLNFRGNHAETAEDDVRIADCHVKIYPDKLESSTTPTAATRGVNSSRLPAVEIVRRGYAVCTACYNDLFPDDPTEWQQSINPMFFSEKRNCAISAWAWGLSRMLDYLETVPELDSKQAAVIGHSRLGKAALWAGANDERFAMVVSNNSGCGGAALSKRKFGETVDVITTAFPHWFNSKFASYADAEEKMNFDQHMLLSLIAPRALYVASATEDLWADPRGEFLALRHANAAYRLFGAAEWPPLSAPQADLMYRNGQCACHLRTGGHALTSFDWMHYLDLADTLRCFRGK